MADRPTDKVSIAKLGEPDPEFAAFLKDNPIPKLDWADIPKLRTFRAAMEKQGLEALGPCPPEVEESYQKIKMRDGYESEIKLFKPTKPPTGGSPLIVLVYGGGFVIGSNDQLTAYGRQLSKLYGATCVNISYRLAPEHKFPTGINDSWDTVKWCAANAASFGADPSKGFLLGGVSAGANITSVVAQKALDEKLSPPLTGLWLCVPLVFPSADQVPEKYKEQWFSHEQNKDAPILNAEAISAIGIHLEPDAASDLYSPYNTKSPHKGLPRTYISVDGLDPLRDDGLIHDQVLREHGVETRLDIWPGVPHAHFSFFPTLSITQKAILDTFAGFAWLLGKKGSSEQVKQDLGGHVAAPSGG